MNIGQRIKEVREARNMTQGELGALCGTTKQTIFKYENGVVTNIPLDRLEKIAEALGVNAAYLMGWEEPAYNALRVQDQLYEGRPPMRFEAAVGAAIYYNEIKNGISADFSSIPEESRGKIRSAYEFAKAAAQISKDRFEEFLNYSKALDENDSNFADVSVPSKVPATEALTDLYFLLNNDGRKKLLDYAFDLVYSGRYFGSGGENTGNSI